MKEEEKESFFSLAVNFGEVEMFQENKEEEEEEEKEEE